jgi:hypothetical protein
MRFQKQCPLAQDVGFKPKDVITRKAFASKLLPTIREKLQEVPRTRTNQEAKQRAKEVVSSDTSLCKSYGEWN